MKVPNSVLHIIKRLAEGAEVSAEQRATVLLWADAGIVKRLTPRPEESGAMAAVIAAAGAK